MEETKRKRVRTKRPDSMKVKDLTICVYPIEKLIFEKAVACCKPRKSLGRFLCEAGIKQAIEILQANGEPISEEMIRTIKNPTTKKV